MNSKKFSGSLALVITICLLTFNLDFKSQNTSYMQNNIPINGTRCSAIGQHVLQTNNGSSQDNTGVGYSALSSNSNGEFNTAVGSSAMLSNNHGNRNTATGNVALFSNLSGN